MPSRSLWPSSSIADMVGTSDKVDGADVAAADFFESIIQVNMETTGSPSGTVRSRGCPNVDNCVKKREVGSDLRSTLKEQTMVSNSTPHSRL